MNKYLKVLIKPSEVFKEEKEKASIKKALLTYLVVGFIEGIIYTIGILLNPQINLISRLIGEFLPIPSQSIKIVFIVFYLVIFPVLSIISVSIFSLIGFIIAKLFRGMGSYGTFLYFASLYYVPIGILSATFSQIPIIDQYAYYILAILVIYPFTVAMQEAFSLSIKRAVIIDAIFLLTGIIIILSPVLLKNYQEEKEYNTIKDIEILVKARESNDISICDLIKDTAIKNNCIAIIEENPSKCGYVKITGSTDWQDDCILSIVERTKNIDLCQSLSNAYNNRYQCMQNIAIEKKDINICYKIPTEDEYRLEGYTYSVEPNRDDCFYRVGITTKDLKNCDLITEERLKITCIAIIQNDINVCGQLEYDFDQQSCEQGFRNFLNGLNGAEWH